MAKAQMGKPWLSACVWKGSSRNAGSFQHAEALASRFSGLCGYLGFALAA